MFQATLESVASFDGVGAHSGKLCSVSISPAAKNAGIVFSNGEHTVEARFDNVSETTLCTALSLGDGADISTIEHLSAALYGLGITNALIETKDPEIPILDGSALPFVQKFLSVGIKKQSSRMKMLKVLVPIKVQEGEKWISLSPANSFSINIKCDFTSKGLETRETSFDFSENDFTKEIALARTFGFFSDAEFLRKNNLAKGASLDNCVVFDDVGRPINKEGLRLPNEPVRHKILDVIGDLSLTRCNIVGRFDGFCPSHRINNRLLHALFEKDTNYEITQ
ncbi:MAG: UDP-3-O-acyl-N-acetylglucosamine deacetylase [Holosporaceae bacterium]|nr:UDP-3-O-acyl-N-acetylglucosamine deacetylase [Holosporaceae bacterium]